MTQERREGTDAWRQRGWPPHVAKQRLCRLTTKELCGLVMLPVVVAGEHDAVRQADAVRARAGKAECVGSVMNVSCEAKYRSARRRSRPSIMPCVGDTGCEGEGRGREKYLAKEGEQQGGGWREANVSKE